MKIIKDRYGFIMLELENYMVYPDGDIQEIDGGLRINDLVDLNGRRLILPLRSSRVIAYRIVSIRVKEERKTRATYHYSELVPAAELASFVARS